MFAVRGGGHHEGMGGPRPHWLRLAARVREEVAVDSGEAAAKRARELFDSGYLCGEAVLLAAAERLGVENDLVPALASGFCSGLARTAGLCGALAGGILAVNLAMGRRDSAAPIDPCYRAVHFLVEGFVRRFGAQECPHLTGCDISTAEGQALFAAGAFRAGCGEFVSGATRLALEAIDLHRPGGPDL